MNKIISILLIFILIFSLTSCGKKLPQEISQDDWANSKQFVELSTGIKMAYVEMGDPNGEVVILQHGMTDNSRSWSMAAPFFAEAGYHVYLPDLRGMGKSEGSLGHYTTEIYANDMKAFFDAMKIDKAILVGHSLGSFTVQNFLRLYPECCTKVVLVSSIPLLGYQNVALEYAYQKYIAPLADDGHPSDAFMDSWYATELAEEEYADIFPTFLANMKKEAQILSKANWTNIFYGLIDSSLEGEYDKFDKNVPILLLHGDLDTMTAGEYQDELRQLLNISDDSYKEYTGIGHNIQFEMPRECAEDILTWIKTGKVNK